MASQSGNRTYERIIEENPGLQDALLRWRTNWHDTFASGIAASDVLNTRNEIRQTGMQDLETAGLVDNSNQAREFWAAEVEEPVTSHIDEEGLGGTWAHGGLVGANREGRNNPSLNDDATIASWDAMWRTTLRRLLRAPPESGIDLRPENLRRNAISRYRGQGLDETEADRRWTEDVEEPVRNALAQEDEGRASASRGTRAIRHRGNGGAPRDRHLPAARTTPSVSALAGPSSRNTNSPQTRGWQPDAQWVQNQRSDLRTIIQPGDVDYASRREHFQRNGIRALMDRGAQPHEARHFYVDQIEVPVLRGGIEASRERVATQEQPGQTRTEEASIPIASASPHQAVIRSSSQAQGRRSTVINRPSLAGLHERREELQRITEGNRAAANARWAAENARRAVDAAAQQRERSERIHQHRRSESGGAGAGGSS